jgi:hypothetical protein
MKPYFLLDFLYLFPSCSRPDSCRAVGGCCLALLSEPFSALIRRTPTAGWGFKTCRSAAENY